MKLANITDVYFDLDHTLWDFDRNSLLAFQSIFKDQNIGVEIEDFLSVYSPINKGYWDSYRNNLVSKEELRYGRLKDSFVAIKYEIDDLLIHRLASSYIDYLPENNYLLQGTLGILKYLSKNYRLHIITNGFEEVQHLKLKKSNIQQFFKTMTTSEEVGVKKPDPQIFQYALQKSGAMVQSSVMIGDNFEADILGGYDHGMRVIYLDVNNENPGTQHPRIQKLKQLRDYL